MTPVDGIRPTTPVEDIRSVLPEIPPDNRFKNWFKLSDYPTMGLSHISFPDMESEVGTENRIDTQESRPALGQESPADRMPPQTEMDESGYRTESVSSEASDSISSISSYSPGLTFKENLHYYGSYYGGRARTFSKGWRQHPINYSKYAIAKAIAKVDRTIPKNPFRPRGLDASWNAPAPLLLNRTEPRAPQVSLNLDEQGLSPFLEGLERPPIPRRDPRRLIYNPPPRNPARTSRLTLLTENLNIPPVEEARSSTSRPAIEQSFSHHTTSPLSPISIQSHTDTLSMRSLRTNSMVSFAPSEIPDKYLALGSPQFRERVEAQKAAAVKTDEDAILELFGPSDTRSQLPNFENLSRRLSMIATNPKELERNTKRLSTIPDSSNEGTPSVGTPKARRLTYSGGESPTLGFGAENPRRHTMTTAQPAESNTPPIRPSWEGVPDLGLLFDDDVPMI